MNCILRLPFNLNGYEIFTTASICITLSTTGYIHPEDVLRDADAALYQAKAHGKARSFDSAMHAQDRALLQLEMELRWAIALSR